MLTNRTKIALTLGGLAMGAILGLIIGQRADAERTDTDSGPAAAPAYVVAPLPSPSTATEPEPAAQPNALPPPEYFPRDPGEWQGLRVESSNVLYCSGVDKCNGALACVNGRCVACTSDSQCAPGEVCSMDHCLRRENMTCRSRRDCAEGQRCYLDGLGGGTPRHNATLSSYCAGSDGENPRAVKPNPFPNHYATPSPLPPEALGVGYMNMARVKERARALLAKP